MKYVIVKEVNTGKLYLDFSTTEGRNFEVVLAKSNKKENLLKRFNTKRNPVVDLVTPYREKLYNKIMPEKGKK